MGPSAYKLGGWRCLWANQTQLKTMGYNRVTGTNPGVSLGKCSKWGLHMTHVTQDATKGLGSERWPPLPVTHHSIVRIQHRLNTEQTVCDTKTHRQMTETTQFCTGPSPRRWTLPLWLTGSCLPFFSLLGPWHPYGFLDTDGPKRVGIGCYSFIISKSSQIQLYGLHQGWGQGCGQGDTWRHWAGGLISGARSSGVGTQL